MRIAGLGVTFFGLLALMLLLLILPFAFPFSTSVILINLLFYTALAYSINFITGMTGYVSFGHVVFLGIGAYALGVSADVYGLDPVLGVLLGAALGLVFALAIGLVTLRFRGVYFAISTVVIALAALNIVLELPQLGGSQGIILNLGFQPYSWYYTIWGIVLFEMLITYYINRGKLGFGIRALKSDEDAARSVGVNVSALKLYLFGLSGLFAGAGGAVFAWTTSGVFSYETFSLTFSLQMLAMIIIGGVGTALGPILGAVVVYLPSYYFLTVAIGTQLIIIGLAVVVIALFIPEGIVGTLKRRSASLRELLE
ncbi:MAG TPA: branched-chain amino acid ABC transporter permease [Nitrososphaerales archaeon]|nr:branched-chain amino acid ABC transporter permease [Nitrososphaerales archaeon]